MPKIFEYQGIGISFYSNEHEPIHVHARCGSSESKGEIIIVDGVVVEIRISKIKGRSPLSGHAKKHFIDFLTQYADAVVKKWIDYFVLHKNVQLDIIQGKIK